MQVLALFRPTKASRSEILIKLVTDATNSQYVARIFRISLELLTKPIDVWIYVPLIAFVVSAPNPVEQRISGPGTSWLRREQLENLKLERRQIDAIPITHHFMTTLIAYT